MAETTLVRTLHDEEETRALGRFLAGQISMAPFSILMDGPLGCGKTALTRAIVPALPGGDAAEVSSPSFTLCNSYPTDPQVLHCDLYRAGAFGVPEDVAEALCDPDACCLVEWAGLLEAADRPLDYLAIAFDISPETCDCARSLAIGAHGPRSEAALAALAAAWPALGRLS